MCGYIFRERLHKINIGGDLQERSGVEMLPSLCVLSEGHCIFLIGENCRMGFFLVCGGFL